MKKNVQKYLSMFLTLVMLLSVMPTAVFAADEADSAPVVSAPEEIRSEEEIPQLELPDVLPEQAEVEVYEEEPQVEEEPIVAPEAAEPMGNANAGPVGYAVSGAPEFSFGPTGTSTEVKLIPGVYELTVQMKKASNPKKDSMAADCIKGSALEVMNNGDAYVNIKLGAKTVGLITTYATNWEIFQQHNINSTKLAAEILSKDNKGNVTEIRFKLPYTNWDGVFAAMHINVMGGMNQECFLKMLFHQAAHNSAKEAAKIDAMIAALGEVSLASEAAITEARNSYDWLVADSKALVKNLATLEAAEAKLAELKQAELDKAAAAAVDAKIAALGEITLESEGAIVEARAAYEALSDVQKTLVLNLAALDEAEAKLAELKQEELDKAAAAAVDAKIAALGEITLESEGAIVEARAAYEALSDVQKTMVLNLATLDQAEAKLAELKQAELDKAAAAAVDAKIAALGEITLESEGAILEARAAYEALSDVQKTLVLNLATLDQAEAKLAELKNPVAPLIRLDSTSMVLGNDLSMKFFVSKDKLTDTAGVYAQITKVDVNGKETVKTVPFASWEDRGVQYAITFDGIAAKEMNDRVTVQLFTAANEAISEPYVDSIHDYALRLIETNQNNQKLVTTVVDMVNYGSACQTHFNYDVQNPASRGFETWQKFATDAKIQNKFTQSATGYYHSTSVETESKLLMNLFFTNLTEGMTAEISYTDHYGHHHELTVDYSDMKVRDNTRYITIHGLVIADVQQMITCTIYTADHTEVVTVQDSIESYTERLVQKGYNGLKALADFGFSAYNYFH